MDYTNFDKIMDLWLNNGWTVEVSKTTLEFTWSDREADELYWIRFDSAEKTYEINQQLADESITMGLHTMIHRTCVWLGWTE